MVLIHQLRTYFVGWINWTNRHFRLLLFKISQIHRYSLSKFCKSSYIITIFNCCFQLPLLLLQGSGLLKGNTPVLRPLMGLASFFDNHLWALWHWPSTEPPKLSSCHVKIGIIRHVWATQLITLPLALCLFSLFTFPWFGLGQRCVWLQEKSKSNPVFQGFLQGSL